ncbi:hypothetical protein D3C75_1312830 [compost metagenome]
MLCKLQVDVLRLPGTIRIIHSKAVSRHPQLTSGTSSLASFREIVSSIFTPPSSLGLTFIPLSGPYLY